MEPAKLPLLQRLLAWWRTPARPARPAPVRPIDPATARVVALVRALPADQRIKWLRRWEGLRLAHGGIRLGAPMGRAKPGPRFINKTYLDQ